ncbi:MAG: YlbF family regulator [Clostridiales Family XIII bacterium]|jgi:cell fate (sporulation/competence/biofilm development) regulator YlbF (YheA/YmcA/DUF963 family)|nr:YlbF family regulator [Clostridiales Family XIII bacterium]
MVHDKAHELAAEIKQSEEYRAYLAAKARAQENPDLVEALNDYQEKQFEMQKKQMLGEQIGPDMMGQMQSLYQILARDPVAAEYLGAQIRFAMMVNDVYSILGEVVKA